MHEVPTFPRGLRQLAEPIPNDIKKQLERGLSELKKRGSRLRLNELYLDGCPPFPTAIIKARMTKAYQNLIGVAGAPWASLVVDSSLDRLEISGIKSGDKRTDEIVWGAWQDNQLDAESKLGNGSALANGRCFATVWRGPGDDGPVVSLDDAATMVVLYEEGSRRKRVAALRHWKDDDSDATYVTLYRPDGVYKFVESGSQTRASGRVKADGTWWEAREPDEEWPLKNPWRVVPVAEVAINRRLKPGCLPYARGEFDHCHGLLDRINLLTFLGLVVAMWMGFPLRGIIGERIVRDDDDNPVAPFDVDADKLAQLEKPDVTTFEFKAADRKNLSILGELDQLAAITKTPRFYFPMEQGLVNLAADTIRASEGARDAKITNYKATTGEGWEEVLRLCGLMTDEEVVLSPRAELKWKDHESAGMAERADAATKVASIGVPLTMVAEKFLNFTQGEIGEMEGKAAQSAFQKLVQAAKAKGSDGGEGEKQEAPEAVAA
jgi:hypothetical protein